jgi:hypothetical protein
MARERRTRSWWQGAVSRWERSGLSARAFAEREGVSSRTLYWWSSALRRGTRAQRGSTTIAPIEIALPRSEPRGLVEVAVGGAVVRVPSGTDVEYVAELVRRIASAR